MEYKGDWQHDNHQEVKNIINQYQVRILAILEPMIKETNITTTVNKLSFDNFTSNGEVDGNIWVLWKGDIQVKTLVITDQCCNMEVTTGKEETIIFSAI